ncbi:hypothetical protein MRX96_019220 [Rhipicephalus microplus]
MGDTRRNGSLYCCALVSCGAAEAGLSKAAMTESSICRPGSKGPPYGLASTCGACLRATRKPPPQHFRVSKGGGRHTCCHASVCIRFLLDQSKSVRRPLRPGRLLRHATTKATQRIGATPDKSIDRFACQKGPPGRLAGRTKEGRRDDVSRPRWNPRDRARLLPRQSALAGGGVRFEGLFPWALPTKEGPVRHVIVAG